MHESSLRLLLFVADKTVPRTEREKEGEKNILVAGNMSDRM